jgi:hypothetical protein
VAGVPGRFLKQMGFEQVASVPGGTSVWEAAGKPLAVGEAGGERPRVIESEWTHAGAGQVWWCDFCNYKSTDQAAYLAHSCVDELKKG